ncbi:hypothetical protein F4055_01320 [Candidatus Poribacteria bacterium]|nr:hypothetical protein [Candidatus Poribacteria bacterium]
MYTFNRQTREITVLEVGHRSSVY